MDPRGKKIKRIFTQKGSTMVETLVSFLVLIMILASLYSIVLFSSNLFMKSVDMSRLNQKFYREIYKKDIDAAMIDKEEFEAGFGAPKDGKEYAALNLTFDDEKTDARNYSDPNVNRSYINLNNIKVYSYVYSGSEVDVEGVIAPSATEFIRP